MDLTNSESFQAVYIEKELRWARRVVPTEQPRAVAWPARVSQLNCPDCVVRSHVAYTEGLVNFDGMARNFNGQHGRCTCKFCDFRKFGLEKFVIILSCINYFCI